MAVAYLLPLRVAGAAVALISDAGAVLIRVDIEVSEFRAITAGSLSMEVVDIQF